MQSEPLAYLDQNGTKHVVPAAYMGAEGRYEDWIYLRILEREWLRPITDEDKFLDIFSDKRPSPRAVVVLTFWTYFETRIERIYRESLHQLPPPILEDMLRRHASIGGRLDRLYRVCFGTTYLQDLRDLGYVDVAEVISDVHKRRNDFTHGKPEAIDEVLVTKLVAHLKREHESWIAVFNKCIKSVTDAVA